MAEKKKPKEPKITGAEKKQRGLFKKRRAGIVLTKDEVKQIKAGRKKLRRDMRKAGIKSKKEFELTASSMGLYFDKRKPLVLFWWWLRGKGIWFLLATGALALAALYGISYITELRGHFTISMSGDMFREGFTISETVGFENPTSHLFATPAEGVPCISIYDIPENVDDIDGAHNADYFAYTFYLRNEGETAQDIDWVLRLNSESLSVSDAAWAMIFLDGKMQFYAKADEDGNIQCLPAADDNTRGYTKAPLYDKALYPDEQYEIIKSMGEMTFWRVKPKPFISELSIDSGRITDIQPFEVHKFTVVIWLEGDDPQCTNDLIGGHLGLEFYMEMVEENDTAE